METGFLKPSSDIAVDLDKSAAAETIQAEGNTEASMSDNAVSVQHTAIPKTELQVDLPTTQSRESRAGLNFVCARIPCLFVNCTLQPCSKIALVGTTITVPK